MRNSGYARFAFLALSAAILAACATGQKQGAAGTYVQDITLATNVKAALFQAPDLGAAEIHVETDSGTVRLSGFVPQPEQVKKAGDLAGKVEGVKKLENRLDVRR